MGSGRWNVPKHVLRTLVLTVVLPHGFVGKALNVINYFLSARHGGPLPRFAVPLYALPDLSQVGVSLKSVSVSRDV